MKCDSNKTVLLRTVLVCRTTYCTVPGGYLLSVVPYACGQRVRVVRGQAYTVYSILYVQCHPTVRYALFFVRVDAACAAHFYGFERTLYLSTLRSRTESHVVVVTH